MRVSRPDHQTQATTVQRYLANSDQEAKQFFGLIIKLEREPKKGATNNPKKIPAAQLNQLASILQ